MYQFLDCNVPITKLLQIIYRTSLFNIRWHAVFKLLSQQPSLIKLIQMLESPISQYLSFYFSFIRMYDSLFNIRLHVVFKLLSQQPTPIKLIQMLESPLLRYLSFCFNFIRMYDMI